MFLRLKHHSEFSSKCGVLASFGSAVVGTRKKFLVRDDFFALELPTSRGGVAISTALVTIPFSGDRRVNCEHRDGHGEGMWM